MFGACKVMRNILLLVHQHFAEVTLSTGNPSAGGSTGAGSSNSK